MKSRIAVCVLLSVGLIGLVGCGSKTQGENADGFRDRIEKAGFKVEFEPKDEGRPGLVEGAATSGDGMRSSFIVSFGPAPERLGPSIDEREGAVWFNAGDGVFFWVETHPVGQPGTSSNEALKMQFKIEDTACQVVADRDCGI